jgi:hypothetical protein
MSEQVGEMITYVATAASEQSSATEEINTNMDQIAKLVKESADGAQRSAKACEDLSSLALDKQKLVGNFRVEKNGHGSQGMGGSGRASSSRQTSQKKKAYAASARLP